MYSPIYSGGLTNHLPMMKKAMKELGFSDQRIEEVSNLYIKERGLEIAKDSEYGKQFLKLRDELEDVSIREYLKGKLNTLPSALFHCLIRLYYAVGDSEEEKSALAYYELAGEEYKLDFPETDKPKQHMKQLIKARLHTKIVFNSPLTMDKFKTILLSPLESLFRVPSKIDIEEIIDVFLDAFHKTRDFYILHVVTGFQALLGLKDYLDLEEAVKEFYKFAQVFIVLNNKFDSGLPSANHKLPYYVKKARFLTDAHDIKLLHSLTKLKEYTSSPMIEDIAQYIIYGDNS